MQNGPAGPYPIGAPISKMPMPPRTVTLRHGNSTVEIVVVVVIDIIYDTPKFRSESWKALSGKIREFHDDTSLLLKLLRAISVLAANHEAWCRKKNLFGGR